MPWERSGSPASQRGVQKVNGVVMFVKLFLRTMVINQIQHLRMLVGMVDGVDEESIAEEIRELENNLREIDAGIYG